MDEYILEKIEVLEGFTIILTPEQLAHIWELKTEISVDNYARGLIANVLEYPL